MDEGSILEDCEVASTDVFFRYRLFFCFGDDKSDDERIEEKKGSTDPGHFLGMGRDVKSSDDRCDESADPHAGFDQRKDRPKIPLTFEVDNEVVFPKIGKSIEKTDETKA